MLTINNSDKRTQVEITSIDQLVPEDHLVRKLDACIDFSFIYDLVKDKYSTTNRDGYREYKSDPKICVKCPYLNKCTSSKNHVKVVTRHIWADYVDLIHPIHVLICMV